MVALTGSELAAGRPAERPMVRPVRRQRRRFVGLMRLVLPGVAIGLIVLVVAWPKIFGDVAGTIAPSGLFGGFSVTEPMRMRHPRYLGTDADGGRPYEVVADQALVDPSDPDRITLEKMHATTRGDTGGLITLDADDGLYQRAVGRLDLANDVQLTIPDGTRFTTQKATIMLTERHAWGDRPVHGVGRRGTLDADAFSIERGGDVAHFSGNVRVVLTPAGREGEAP